VDRHRGTGRDTEAGHREARGGRAARGARGDLAERLKRDGVEPVGSTPQDFAALIGHEIVQWRGLAQSAKITLE
jgi:hypothetical protein